MSEPFNVHNVYTTIRTKYVQINFIVIFILRTIIDLGPVVSRLN